MLSGRCIGRGLCSCGRSFRLGTLGGCRCCGFGLEFCRGLCFFRRFLSVLLGLSCSLLLRRFPLGLGLFVLGLFVANKTFALGLAAGAVRVRILHTGGMTFHTDS